MLKISLLEQLHYRKINQRTPTFFSIEGQEVILLNNSVQFIEIFSVGFTLVTTNFHYEC